ncbi:MAG: sulfotransferase domain-containing protein [Myxococcales bacterium]|nr:sulfotransferase domain-containing protein [Myxococcales bacterium]
MKVPLLSSVTLLAAAQQLAVALGRPMSVAGPALTKMFVDPPMPRSLREHVFTGREVLIATFLKSGTNWAMQIALQIAYRGAAEFDHIHELVPWPDAPPIKELVSLRRASAEVRSPTGKVVIKTHLPASMVPYDPRAAYITVIRDPKEVAISADHFLLGTLGVVDAISFDEWYERMVDDGPVLTAWARHTAGFWAWRGRDNVLSLTYPQMKADLDGSVRRFAAIMGVELSAAEHAEVVRRASFEHMRAHNHQFSPPTMPLQRRRALPPMIRRGVAGGSDELLDARRQRAIDACCQAKLRALGCDFPYAEHFARR